MCVCECVCVSVCVCVCERERERGEDSVVHPIHCQHDCIKHVATGVSTDPYGLTVADLMYNHVASVEQRKRTDCRCAGSLISAP